MDHLAVSEPDASHLLVPCPCCSVCCVPCLGPLAPLFPPLRPSACPRVRAPCFSCCPPFRPPARASFRPPSCPRLLAALLPCASFACGQVASFCAARLFALPRSRLSASCPVLSACSASGPPLLARSLFEAALPATHPFPFHSNSGVLLLFSVRAVRAAGWALVWLRLCAPPPGVPVRARRFLDVLFWRCFPT